MTVGELTALVVATASVLGAMAAILREVRQTHRLVNSRMDELLALTAKSSRAEGRLAADPPESTERPPTAPPDPSGHERGV